MPRSFESEIASITFAVSPEMTTWPGVFRFETSTSVSAARARTTLSSAPIIAAIAPVVASHASCM